MKTFAEFLTITAATVAGFQWWQIVYRLRLFFGEHQGKPGLNHIGDGDFTFAYVVNGLLLLASLLSARVFRKNTSWKTVAVTVGILNLLGWVTLIVMHQTGALVEYGEFIRNRRQN